MPRRITRKPATEEVTSEVRKPRGTRKLASGRSTTKTRPTSPSTLTEKGGAPLVGRCLKRLRTERGFSLEALSRLSGVSRAMLGQIELEQSTPTITVVWKIAQALQVPFSELLDQSKPRGPRPLRAAVARHLQSADGSFRSRAIFPAHGPTRVEFYELTLAGESEEFAEGHAPGTIENLVVADGMLEISVAGEVHKLRRGDALSFRAEVAHTYRNPGKREGRYYLLITYSALE